MRHNPPGPAQMIIHRIGIGRSNRPVHPGFAQHLIGGQSQAPVTARRQHPGIFDRQIGPLRQKRQGRMGRIADKRDVVAVPVYGNLMPEQTPFAGLGH